MRFRARPDAAMAQRLRQWVGHQRFIYNAKVDEDRYFAGMRLSMLARGRTAAEAATPLDRAYAQFRGETTPWLGEVPSQVLRIGAERWFEGKQRQLKGLARAPRRRNRLNFDSVRVSSELFEFRELDEPQGDLRHELVLGNDKFGFGSLPFTAHRPYEVPKSLTLRCTGGQWFVSFSYEHAAPKGFVARNEEELAYELDLLDGPALETRTLGLDRNVADNCLATSDGRFYALSAVQKARIARKAVGAKRHQRRLARQEKGSANSRKTRDRLARKLAYKREVLRDFSHQTSHDLLESKANDAGVPQLLVLEALKVGNMTARPKARQDETGRWLRNGAASKAGLNRAILSSAWGRIAEQLGYKAARRNVLVLQVPAAYSSQECSRCGHTHPGNRDAQRFACQRCGLEAHADTNAARIIAGRGIGMVRDQKVVVKARKRVAYRRRATNAGLESPDVPVEGGVSRDEAKADIAQCPRKQEGATTTAPSGV
ncbi:MULTISPECIES: RNA-guided endonuclease TnpB family protein [unclassified Variovorax]|uniref:RNA-guided endonuclease InsQ/TnpB family protein n=1 Tax=unclassified Variovorax TaxID=663243 RepID=UPI0011AF14F5|nr:MULTISPECIES: RNA-guided endonuclease TnpB family protein [unclassified Variovorax]